MNKVEWRLTPQLPVEGREGDLLSVVGSGSDAENGVVDVLELFGKRQVDQEFTGGVRGERGDCRAGIATQRVRSEG